jgi:hypothetical protein
MNFDGEDLEHGDIFRRVDWLDPPGRWPSAEDSERAERANRYAGSAHRGGREFIPPVSKREKQAATAAPSNDRCVG